MFNIKMEGRCDALLGEWVNFEVAAKFLIGHYMVLYPDDYFYIVQFTGDGYECCVGEPHIHCH